MEYATPKTYELHPHKRSLQTTVRDRTISLPHRFDAPRIHFHAALPKLRLFEVLGAAVFAIGSFGYGFLLLFRSFEGLPSLSLQGRGLEFLLIGVLCILFIWYRRLASSAPVMHISDYPKKKPLPIMRFMTPQAAKTIEYAVLRAHHADAGAVDTLRLFESLLKNIRIQKMFGRLAVPLATIEESVQSAMSERVYASLANTKLTETTTQALFHTYVLATEARAEQIDVTELLFAVVLYDERIQDILYDLEIDTTKLQNMLLWLRTQEMLRRRQSMQTLGASHVSKHGIDRAMTAVATPFLNSYSHDITLDVKYGRTAPCIARRGVIDDILRSGSNGRPDQLLIGERGSGKRTVAEGLAARIVSGSVPEQFADKRMVSLSLASLVAGTSVSGAQERLLRMFKEVSRAGNIVLYIENIHDLVSTNADGLDVSEALASVLSSKDTIVIATTTPEGYKQHIARSAMGALFATVQVESMDTNQCIQVLESKAPYLELQQDVSFTYQSLAAATEFANKFVQGQVLPTSAIGLMTEAGAYASSTRGSGALVTAEDVAAIVSKQTGIPVTAINEDESSKLLALEEAMHERVVGQTEAVQMVANALRRARAAIRATNRPIANFLFLGPTGVGKTELAKTIADVYFGGEERMIRLDMSEYQDVSSIERLIGIPGRQGTGVLTEAVRDQPFALILLDEMEKADPKIRTLFLQVFDDGRLTDSVGRTVDFSNTIIIATSNAGTSYVQDQMSLGTEFDAIRNELLHGTLQEYYRPEFLNRFDGIVLFRSLQFEEIKQIAGLLLARTRADLEARGIGLEVTNGALKSLATAGFDPEFGARPMRRAIQDRIENPIASLLLSGKVPRRSVIHVGDNLEVTISN